VRSSSPPRTVGRLLSDRAVLDPDRIAVEVHGGTTLTFAEWDRRADAVARGLRDRGLRHGEPVGLLFGIRHWAEYVTAFCGVVRAGGVAVPCSDRLAPGQVGEVLADAGAALLIAGERPERDLPGGTPVAALDAVETPGDDAVAVPVRAGDRAQILYTSGTTGRPKGVVATHANLTHGSATHPRRRRLGHSERFVHAFPVGTNAGQAMLLNALDARPGALVPARFTPGRFARLVEESAAGSVFVVPAMAVELLRSGELDRRDLSAVLLLGSTAAALPSAVAVRLAAALPQATIVNYYTSTEAAPAQTTMVFDPSRPGSVGRAVDGTLRVGDPHSDAVPVGEVGEVWLRSPFPRHYHADEAATRATFRDGWVRMGDLGRLDGDGYLYLVDRERDVIKSGAHKVSTLRVESELLEHRAVGDAAVFGVPHPVLGTEVTAAVVLAEDATAAQLRAFLLERLADHEVPARIIAVDVLPRNDGGKVLKRLLVERHARVPASITNEERQLT
jgi:long-chain acyl-CoA synthetase